MDEDTNIYGSVTTSVCVPKILKKLAKRRGINMSETLRGALIKKIGKKDIMLEKYTLMKRETDALKETLDKEGGIVDD